MSRRFRIPRWVLFRVAARDGWRCHICVKAGFDGRYRPNDPWQIDHDVALANGGTNHVKNLRLAHQSCNEGKGKA